MDVTIDEASQHRLTKSDFLTFRLGQEEYGIDIMKVQELRCYEHVTKVASAPDFIKGLVNLRGIIVPIVDMRIKFKAGAPSYDQFTVVIILNICERIIGIVVDSVSDVVTLPLEEVRPPPAICKAFDVDYLIGLGTLDERMLLLIDIDKVLAGLELVQMGKVEAR